MVEEFNFSSYEQREILEYIKQCLQRELAGLPLQDYPNPRKLKKLGSAFVHLERNDGSFRGCIGSVEAVESLGDSLKRNSINAAFIDPYSPPVSSDELDELMIEVAVVKPAKLSLWSEFEVGKHGIILKVAQRRAVFLPEIAQEQGWSATETFNNLAQKAGLPETAWQSPETEIWLFETEKFRNKNV